MGTTPIYGWPYPALSDSPNGPVQMQSLATAIETTVNAWSPRFSRKTSDESYTSDTSLNNIVGLSVSLEASATYLYEALVVAISSSETPDLRTQMSLPAGSTLHMETVTGHLSSLSGVEPWPVQSLVDASSTNNIVGSGAVGEGVPLWRRGLLITTTAGTLAVMGSQLTSSGTATTIKAGSYLEARRVA